MVWTYSNYITYDPGATRLSRFRSHIQEVSDQLSAETAARGRSHSTNVLQSYLDRLMAREAAETSRCNLASGSSVAFTRARPRPIP